MKAKNSCFKKKKAPRKSMLFSSAHFRPVSSFGSGCSAHAAGCTLGFGPLDIDVQRRSGAYIQSFKSQISTAFFVFHSCTSLLIASQKS